MSRRLLDTDILSEVIKGKNQNVATSAANYLAQHGRLTISAVSVAEIIHGFRRKGLEQRLAQFEASLADAEVLDFGKEAARLAGRINGDLALGGKIIGMPDVMIAGIALSNSLTLVTGNVAHFEYVREAGYDLAIENWKSS